MSHITRMKNEKQKNQESGKREKWQKVLACEQRRGGINPDWVQEVGRVKQAERFVQGPQTVRCRGGRYPMNKTPFAWSRARDKGGQTRRLWSLSKMSVRHGQSRSQTWS